jgi:hypothetical protein
LTFSVPVPLDHFPSIHEPHHHHPTTPPPPPTPTPPSRKGKLDEKSRKRIKRAINVITAHFLTEKKLKKNNINIFRPVSAYFAKTTEASKPNVSVSNPRLMLLH